MPTAIPHIDGSIVAAANARGGFTDRSGIANDLKIDCSLKLEDRDEFYEWKAVSITHDPLIPLSQELLVH